MTKLTLDNTAGFYKLANLHYQLGEADESLKEIRDMTMPNYINTFWIIRNEYYFYGLYRPSSVRMYVHPYFKGDSKLAKQLYLSRAFCFIVVLFFRKSSSIFHHILLDITTIFVMSKYYSIF